MPILCHWNKWYLKTQWRPLSWLIHRFQRHLSLRCRGGRRNGYVWYVRGEQQGAHHEEEWHGRRRHQCATNTTSVLGKATNTATVLGMARYEREWPLLTPSSSVLSDGRGSHVVLCLIVVRVVRGRVGGTPRGGGGGGPGGRGPHSGTGPESHWRRAAARHFLRRAGRPHVGHVERAQRACICIPGKGLFTLSEGESGSNVAETTPKDPKDHHESSSKFFVDSLSYHTHFQQRPFWQMNKYSQNARFVLQIGVSALLLLFEYNTK